MPTPAFLGQGRSSGGAAVSSSAPPSPANVLSGGGAVSQFRGELSDVMSGRISLLMLDTLALMLIGFWWWTRNVQGGG